MNFQLEHICTTRAHVNSSDNKAQELMRTRHYKKGVAMDMSNGAPYREVYCVQRASAI